jgi:hypothetical protein
MSHLRQALFCLAAAIALLAPASAARATTTISGNLFYTDCVTPFNGGAVTIQVFDSSGVTQLTPKLNSLNISIPTPPNSYTVTFDQTTLPAQKYITIKFIVNNVTSRTVSGVNGIAPGAAPPNKGQIIDIGLSVDPPACPCPPPGPLPPTVTITGKFKQNNGTTPLLPGDKVNVTAADCHGMSVPINNPPVPVINTSGYTIQISSANVMPTDKTITLTFTHSGQTWSAAGIVGGDSRGQPVNIDIAFK